eukprot:scaffold12388_cov122-Isochrysis_galbana.AAC.4
MGDAEKNLGNEKFKAGDYNAAITHFTNAINIEPTHVLYSNRSACYCALRKYALAQTMGSAWHSYSTRTELALSVAGMTRH